MHHFGEDFTTGRIEEDRFVIVATHHGTQAQVTLSGPIIDVFETKGKVMDENGVRELARNFAHFLKNYLR